MIVTDERPRLERHILSQIPIVDRNYTGGSDPIPILRKNCGDAAGRPTHARTPPSSLIKDCSDTLPSICTCAIATVKDDDISRRRHHREFLFIVPALLDMNP
eukprot:scaffold31977_cov51-Attheya_sp.AAC.5